MNKLEQEMVASMSRYGGKKRFGNTTLKKVSWSDRYVIFTEKSKNYAIFAKTGYGNFWSDPFDGKNKTVNSRLAALKETFLNAKEVPQEIIYEMSNLTGEGIKWLYGNNFFWVKNKNNTTRYFSTRAGAANYASEKGSLVETY